MSGKMKTREQILELLGDRNKLENVVGVGKYKNRRNLSSVMSHYRSALRWVIE